MKLAIIRPYPNILSESDYNVQEFGLAKALLREKMDVDVYCAGYKRNTEVINYKCEDHHQVRIFRLPFRTFLYYQGVFGGLSELLKKGNYDILQTQGYEQVTSFWVTWLGASLDIPVILHEGLYENDYGRLMNFIQEVFHQSLGRYMRKKISTCIAKTQSAQHGLVSNGFCNVTTLPIGLDVEKFKTFSPISWKDRFGLEKNSSILLYVGIIEPRRNVDFLIRVTAKILQRKQNVFLVVAGSGPDEIKCIELTKKLNVEKSIFFIGKVKQTELPTLYKTADLFLMASDFEIVGMVLLESLFFGLPVISTPTAGGLDIVKEKCGKLIEGLDENEWAEFIITYLKQPQKYKYKEYLNELSFERTWDRLGKRYTEFYREAVKLHKNRKKHKNSTNIEKQD